jgi:hypothetical protein
VYIAYNFSRQNKKEWRNMSENNEPQTETYKEQKNDSEPDIKAQIKIELKKEMKQEFTQLKKKKLNFFFKLFIVFLFGLGIGFFAGHHDHGYRQGYMMHGGHQMEMHHGMNMGKHMKYNDNGTRGD